MEGTVIHRLKNALIVALDGGPQIRATLSDRMQGHDIRVVAGDRVSVDRYLRANATNLLGHLLHTEENCHCI
jgi:hypothetical protein